MYPAIFRVYLAIFSEIEKSANSDILGISRYGVPPALISYIAQLAKSFCVKLFVMFMFLRENPGFLHTCSIVLLYIGRCINILHLCILIIKHTNK